MAHGFSRSLCVADATASTGGVVAAAASSVVVVSPHPFPLTRGTEASCPPFSLRRLGVLTGTGARNVDEVAERRVRLRMFLDGADEEEREAEGREDSNCLRRREPNPAIFLFIVNFAMSWVCR